jgi:pimeloyl-ACP methyl ester carboxylesterase
MRLVLLPGLDGTGELFQSFLKVLPSSLTPQVVFYPTEQYLTYKELVSLVQSVLPPKEPFVLLGESFSGPLSLKVAALSPPNLRAVILCASFVSNPVPPSLTWLASFPMPLLSLVGHFSAPDMFVRFLAAGMDSPSDLLELFRFVKRKVRPRVLAERVRAVQEIDAREALKNCPFPILYLIAKQDSLISSKCIDEVRNLKPNITVFEIDSPHFILQRKSQEAAAAIVHFLEILSGSRRPL